MKYLRILLIIFGLTSYAQPSWQTLPNAYSNVDGSRFDDVYFLNENLGWAANGWNASVYKTSDGGLTWTEQLDEANLSGDYYFRNIVFLNENIGFLGTLNGAFFKTTDGGDNWSIVNNISPNPNAICGLDVIGPSTIYGCGAYFEPAHIIKSTDSGETWQHIDMSAYASGLVEIKFLTETLGYVSGKSSTGAIILKTTDGGTTWNEIYNSNIAGEYVWKLQILDSDNDILFGSIETTAPNPGKLIKSVDGGINWVSHNAPESTIQAVGFINENVGWMGGHNTGFYETTNGGLSWTNLNFGHHLNRIFFVNSSLAYASGTTIYKFTSESLSTKEIANTYQEKLLAIELIKNPVQNTLRFTIDYKGSDNILINLHDIQGKLIKRLSRESIIGPLKKEYSFDVSALSSGTYIIDFHNNLRKVSKKFLKL